MSEGDGRRPAAGSATLETRGELRYFFAALAYFTRVPVPRGVGLDASDLGGAIRYFSLVGALVGALGAIVFLAALRVFPVPVAVLLSMVATLAVTGAFHEDGLADSCDAFGGGATRDDVLRIMRDSRIGAFGAIGLVMALVLKWQTLAALPPIAAAWLMVAAHAASRALAASYLVTLDYARAEGKAQPVAQRLSVSAYCLVTVLGFPWLLWPVWRGGLLALGVTLVLRAALARYFVRRIGGYTGDCLGLAQQIFEIVIYLVLLGWISF
ncbi:adenosylcobinamide-GDP ribazoletransferase [Trinickia caryophylli]|uniref:Adenosylcobinamide-GDP ribazoletransferase n=1 Tax=Trinickia caryophylli TaxID=28094 RepID=A0A1X7GXE7_TRICW|nr:adenosylcobinamide-GDP ribazoletransferase [Trinickia caryophylli]PMS10157.1 adenosylcobinamide-GDP ribazoletransferase [Trinickia caryophylli]TRX18257.1 adenosylcobinamide-GDP ribazoletransferase [Trinickia caryophylli]WQE10957.1 adenosylcobinamide-GDP ribazoletransferase [Trinickia caryophylli]SMF76252.1 cobalamin-5'-phosphate synthase [Trinickia caryophylli]GLU35436.1 adenosylcobinamide-GDP ribazoletransferase [Trinickia caryophylli]